MKKKLLTLALVAAMALTAVACGSKKDEAANGKKTLVMATNAEFPPYEYYEGQDIVGIDADIAKAVAEKLGFDFEIEDMEFGAIVDAVKSGKADFGLAGMSWNEDRAEQVNFTDTYAHATQVVIVKEDSEYTSVDDLAGKTVGVQTGTTGDMYAGDLTDKVERYSKGFEAVLALTQDKIDAVIIDDEPAKVFAKETEGIKVLDEPFTEEDYAMIIAKENTELLEDVNKAIAELKADGTLQKIIDKYITAE